MFSPIELGHFSLAQGVVLLVAALLALLVLKILLRLAWKLVSLGCLVLFVLALAAALGRVLLYHP